MATPQAWYGEVRGVVVQSRHAARRTLGLASPVWRLDRALSWRLGVILSSHRGIHQAVAEDRHDRRHQDHPDDAGVDEHRDRHTDRQHLDRRVDVERRS